MEELQVSLQELVFQKQIDLINILREKENEISQLKAEESKLTASRKFKEVKLEEFKTQIKEIFEGNGIEKVQTDIGTISIRQNPISVDVVDIESVPEEYKTVKATISVDKKKIIDNFKRTGEMIEGVNINTQNTSLQVK